MFDMGTAGGWSATVGAAIEAARKAAGMSAVELSALTAHYGVRLHRVAISKIEAGARDVTLPELAAIAGALDVAPIALLVPNVLEPLEILPGLEVIGTEVLGWFTGIGNGAPMGGHTDSAGHDLGLRWAWANSWPAPERMRLVEVEEAIKYQCNEIDKIVEEPELPTQSEISKSVRAENLANARKVLEMLKSEWDMRVMNELYRQHGLQNPPPAVRPYLKDRLTELTGTDDA